MAAPREVTDLIERFTRNTKDFRKSAIKALDPAEFLSALEI